MKLPLLLICCFFLTLAVHSTNSLETLNPFPPAQLSLTNSSITDHPSVQQQASVPDGTQNSRSALSSLLFSIPTTILGLSLLLLGRALPRFFPSFAFAAAFALPTWALSVNLSGPHGLADRSLSESSQNILIWGVVTGSFLFGFTLSLLIGHHAYPFALYLLSIEAGLAIGISILIFSNQLTIHHPIFRWIFLTLPTFLLALITAVYRPAISISLACACCGAFLLFLGVDLLAMENNGMSCGIRFLFDHNPHHAQGLAVYNPPTVTRILLSISWACMLLGAAYQYKFLDRPFHPVWVPKFRRKLSASSVQSTVLIDHDVEKNELAHKGISALTASSQEDQTSSSPACLDQHPTFPASPQPQEFESPSQSEQRCTTDSYDTGLSAIPELTEHSTSGRGGSRSGSGSGRGISITFPHSHRYPSNATSNSVRRSNRSSEFQSHAIPPPPTSGPVDPSSISVSPPRTVPSEATVFPDDSISQATRQRLGLTIYSNSGFIEEETEAMLTPLTDAFSPVGEDNIQTDREGPNGGNINPSTPPPIDNPPTPGSTGLLTRIADAFGGESTSMGRPDLQSTPRSYGYGEQASEEQALQSDARRWARLAEGQSPYEHTGRLRRDLHSWTSEELNIESRPTN